MQFRNTTNGEIIEAEESDIALFRTQPHLKEVKLQNEDEEITDSPRVVADGGKRKRAA
jgi:hypothetical protein